MVGKNELNSLESYLTAITRNSHFRSLWSSRACHHSPQRSAFLTFARIVFLCTLWGVMWPWDMLWPQKCKQESCVLLLEEVLRTTTQFATLPSTAVMIMEANVEMSFHQPGQLSDHDERRLLARPRWTHSYEWEINLLS